MPRFNSDILLTTNGRFGVALFAFVVALVLIGTPLAFFAAARENAEAEAAGILQSQNASRTTQGATSPGNTQTGDACASCRHACPACNQPLPATSAVPAKPGNAQTEVSERVSPQVVAPYIIPRISLPH